MYRCKICGEEIEEPLENNLEEHVREKHFMDYRGYVETITLEEPSTQCWKCGNPRYTLSPVLQGVYLPCPGCIDRNTKSGIQDIFGDIVSEIKDYEGRIIRSKYYQYLLSLSQTSRSRLYPMDFKVQEENLKLLKQTSGVRVEKSNIFRVIPNPGRSSVICKENIEGLKIIPESLPVVEVGEGVYEICGMRIVFPEIIPYDPKHHSRGSILNPTSKRPTKRLKFSGTGECIRFWNVPNPTTRTIFKLTDVGGVPVSFSDLPNEIRWKIKFGILKTKAILSRVFDIYNEILKYLSGIKDSVFLLNSVKFPASIGDLMLNFTWGWEDHDFAVPPPGHIKLSIL